LKLLIKFDIIRVDQSINNYQEKPNPQETPNKLGGPGKNMGPGASKMQNIPLQAPSSPSANFLSELNKPTQPAVKPYVLGDVEDINLPDRKYFIKVQMY